MTIHLLTIPDSPDQWPEWLEQQLVSLHLGKLVEELRLHPDELKMTKLNQIFSSDELRSVIRGGLADVGIEKIQQLLHSPDALLKLQENILLNETPYWKNQGLADQLELREAVVRVKPRLKAEVNRSSPSSTEPSVSNADARSGNRLAWMTVIATGLLLGAFLWQFGSAGDSANVLGEAMLTANDVSTAAEYFERIAASGQKWFEQPRDTPEQLSALLQITSRNCETLINAEHEALTDAERIWFVEKCVNWKTKLDVTLADLQADRISVDAAKQQADAVMNKLVQVLRAGPMV